MPEPRKKNWADSKKIKKLIYLFAQSFEDWFWKEIHVFIRIKAAQVLRNLVEIELFLLNFFFFCLDLLESL